MSAEQVALAFKAWAQENNLLGQEYPITLQINDVDRDAQFDALRISAASESILRQRQLLGVGFNQADNQVIVLTARKVIQREQKVLPQTIGADDVQVKYVHAGNAQAGTQQIANTPRPYSIKPNGVYCCGSSIHPATAIGAGTLGCLVRDQAGTLFGLSNNHVSGLCSYAIEGDKIIAPGHVDINAKGIDPFTLGYHSRSLPMVPGTPDNIDVANNSDAALIKIIDEALVSSHQGLLYDTPNKVAPLSAGMVVKKVGRTTGLTSGAVTCQMAGSHPVTYTVQGIGTQVAFFEPVFLIRSLNPAQGPFSINGDSGSLVVAEIGGEPTAVGIVFAGDSQGNSFALSLPPILQKLQVDIVSNHNI